MNIIKFKIRGFDEHSGSLLISFASDTTVNGDPEHYETFAFQPLTMWPDVSDKNELLKKIAESGLYHAASQERKEKFTADNSRVNSLKSLVGTTHVYNVSDLIQAQQETPSQII